MRVGNHIYRKQMVVPMILKFLLFGPFFSKIGLDPCITVVRETKKNIHLHIPSSSSLASLFTIAGLCPVDFIHKKKRVRVCGKVYFKILSGAKLGRFLGLVFPTKPHCCFRFSPFVLNTYKRRCGSQNYLNRPFDKVNRSSWS